MGVHYEEMMAAEMDACLFFNVARIEEAVKAGKFSTIGNSKVPVVDGTRASNQDPKTALTCYCADSEEPARREHQPGRQVLRLLRQAFADGFGDRACPRC